MNDDPEGTVEHQVDAAIRWLQADGHTAKQISDSPKRYEVDGQTDLTEYEVVDLYLKAARDKGALP